MPLFLVELIELIAIAETFMFTQGHNVEVKIVNDPNRPTALQKLANNWRTKYLMQNVSEVTLAIAEDMLRRSQRAGESAPMVPISRA